MEIKTRTALLGLLLTGLLFALAPVSAAWAEGEITARYLAARGTEIVLEIQVPTPAPGSLIVIQKIPRGSVLQSAQPQAKKSGQGEIKWLIRQPKVGPLILRATFAEAIPAGAVSAVIRCKDPVSGKMMTIKVP